MPSTTITNETTLVDLKNKLIDSSSSLKSTMSNNDNNLLEKQESNSDLPSPTTSIKSPIITNNDMVNPLSVNEGSDMTQLPTNLDYNDLDILIKMERANKEMENNHRSAQSILLSNTSSSNGTATNNNNNSSPQSHSLSRRASFTSCEINSLNEDANSKMDEISWELWNQIINDWNTWSKKKPTQLKEYIRKGIPLYLRPLAWQYLCGANLTDAKEKFKDYIKKQSACEKIIRRDIDRTYPDQDFFRNPVGQESLFNVMKAYSIHDPEVGYCQGSAFICGLLLIQNIPEEEAFAIFVQIMTNYNLREIYKPNMYYLGLCMFQLETLLKETLPDLHRHFTVHAFHTSMYSSSWFLTLFTTALPLPLVCRIFDIFLNEGFEIIFRVGLALLEFHKDNLMLLDMEGMLKYFQKELPTKHESDHEGILNKAFAIKYNQRKMKKLEKDFSVIKKEEQEEQVEMRRLRAENKLLKQRIDNLEKESANLADRLIKGQVINAQNAESIYILKNENQKLKDKIEELMQQTQIKQTNDLTNEKELLHEKVNMLLEENSKLRETPDNQRFEEELVQVKMREAEAQLAIKELQKTIHVLNLEYQEFIKNRSAAILSLSTSSVTLNGNGSTMSSSSNSTNSDMQTLEEELLKVKMREAETQSEMKSLNLKLMQLETEKQVAYNQIKRQDDEIRKLNLHIQLMQEKEMDTKNQLVEYRRQLDDKEAQVKESNMTHKLQEAEDAHVIAELRQRVASLEVQIQELVTTGQLNDSEKNLYNCIGGSTDKIVDFSDDMKYMHLMSSQTSLQSDKFNFMNNNKPTAFINNNRQLQGQLSMPSTPTTQNAPVNLMMNDINNINNNNNNNNNSNNKYGSSTVSSNTSSSSSNSSNMLKRTYSEKTTNELKQSTAATTNGSNLNQAFNFIKNLANSSNGSLNNSRSSDKNNFVIKEYIDSENDQDDEDDMIVNPNINNINSKDDLDKSIASSISNNTSDSNDNNNRKASNSDDNTVFKIADIDLSLRPPVIDNLSTDYNGDFVKATLNNNDNEDD